MIEFEIQNQLAEKNPRAVLLSNHVRMLSEPAQAGAHGPGFIHRRLNINADLSFHRRFLFTNPRQQRREFRLHHIVIIVAPGVT